MRNVKEFSGITENILAFKEEVANANKITFAGMPGVCSPFAELFAYAVRDKESVFVTGLDLSTARKVELTPQGMQFSEDADPHADVVALLGGLTLPKANIKTEDVNETVSKILKKDGKLLGLCYNKMFQNAGWDKEIEFDCIINGNLEGFVLKK